MKTKNFFTIVLCIMATASFSQVTLTHLNTHQVAVNTHRPEIMVSSSGDFYVAVRCGGMSLNRHVGTLEHYIYHYNSLWNLVDSFPITSVANQYGEPVDHRAMIINGEIVVVYQSVVWKDSSLWVYNNSPMDHINSISQSLMLARFSLSGTELFRGTIVDNLVDTTNTFSDISIAWDGNDLIVSSGTFPPMQSVRIRKVDLSNANIIDTYLFTTNVSTIPGPFGNSLLPENGQLKVFSCTPTGTYELTVSQLDSNFNITGVTPFYDAQNEQTFPTGNLFYNNYYFIGHDERPAGGSTDIIQNPYFPYVKILDDQLNVIGNVQAGDTGMYHVHPVIAHKNDTLYVGWSKRVRHPNGQYTPQVFVEEYKIDFPSQTVENNFYKTDVILYPNPAHCNVNLHMPENNCQIRVLDVFGNPVYEKVLNSDEESLNLNLPDGIYFLEVTSKGFIQTKKIGIIK